MYAIVIILTVIVAVLLIAVVLIQKSKGGGLASGFSGANQYMGVRHTNDFIEKTTWTLAGAIAVLAVVSVFVMPRDLVQTGSRVKPAGPVQVEGTEYATPAPAATPVEAVPAEAPTPAAAPAAPVE